MINSNLQYAGFFRRFAAYFIDSLIFSPIISIMLFYSGLAGSLLDSWIRIIVYMLITISFWVTLAATPGKLIMSCKVLDEKTLNKIDIQQAVLRYISYFISFLILGFGFLRILWHGRKQALHDTLAGTVVVVDATDKDDESQKSLTKLISEMR